MVGEGMGEEEKGREGRKVVRVWRGGEQGGGG